MKEIATNRKANFEYFIEEKTHGLIKPDLQFSIETLFVLMNTLYLKDIWNDWGGDLNTTSETKFKNANGNVSSKELFSNKSSLKIFTSFSLYKYGLSIIYANRHFAQLLHHFHSFSLLPTLQLLNVV